MCTIAFSSDISDYIPLHVYVTEECHVAPFAQMRNLSSCCGYIDVGPWYMQLYPTCFTNGKQWA